MKYMVFVRPLTFKTSSYICEKCVAARVSGYHKGKKSKASFVAPGKANGYDLASTRTKTM